MIADGNAAARNAMFYGWAAVSVRNAAVNGRQVRASPINGNRYHADIVLPDLAEENRDEQTRHAQELADSANWRERPATPERQ